MNPDEPRAPTHPSSSGDPTDPADPNAALQKLLQAELAAHEAQPPPVPGAEPTFFGMTMAGIFVGFVLSVVGLAMANYGRKTSNVVIGVFGVVMMAVPFFVTSTVWLLVAGTVLVGLRLVMKKLQMF